MRPKYQKEWLSIAEAIELVGGDAAGLELAIREEKLGVRITSSYGSQFYLINFDMFPTVRLDAARDVLLIKDNYSPYAKDIEHPAPRFSRQEITTAFGFSPSQPAPHAEESGSKKKERLRRGGRLRMQDWYPIDLFIVAYIYELGIPSESEVRELTNRLQEHVDETYNDPPGREELHARVKTVLADFNEKLCQVRIKGYT
jgi:hypothetical protein